MSRATGVVASVVIGGLGKLCAGAPATPENTMFHTEPDQLPKLLSREYHCCCDTEEPGPEPWVSAMYPPLAKPLLAGASSSPPCTSIRRNGPACATAQR